MQTTAILGPDGRQTDEFRKGVEFVARGGWEETKTSTLIEFAVDYYDGAEIGEIVYPCKTLEEQRGRAYEYWQIAVSDVGPQEAKRLLAEIRTREYS